METPTAVLLASIVAGLDHGGGADLLVGHALLEGGDVADAAGAAWKLETAVTAGLPAEAMPHALLLRGIALLRDGRPGDAVDVLAAGWIDHPDFLALATALGIALCGVDRWSAAAGPLYAASVGDDPDGTLDRYRGLLDGFHALVGHR